MRVLAALSCRILGLQAEGTVDNTLYSVFHLCLFFEIFSHHKPGFGCECCVCGLFRTPVFYTS